jgi:hypothetical protein
VARRSSRWSSPSATPPARRPPASSSAPPRADPARPDPETAMLDVIFVLTTLAFFAISLAFVAGCDHL